MAFRFRLQTVLNVRQMVEEQAQIKLAKELGTLERHKLRLTQLKDERINTIEDFEKKKSAMISAALFSFYVDAIAAKELMIEFQKNTINVQEKIVQQVREEFTEKMRARKVIERIREKDFLAYTKEEIRKEQQSADEMAVLRHGAAGTLQGA